MEQARQELARLRAGVDSAGRRQERCTWGRARQCRARHLTCGAHHLAAPARRGVPRRQRCRPSMPPLRPTGRCTVSLGRRRARRSTTSPRPMRRSDATWLGIVKRVDEHDAAAGAEMIGLVDFRLHWPDDGRGDHRHADGGRTLINGRVSAHRPGRCSHRGWRPVPRYAQSAPERRAVQHWRAQVLGDTGLQPHRRQRPRAQRRSVRTSPLFGEPPARRHDGTFPGPATALCNWFYDLIVYRLHSKI